MYRLWMLNFHYFLDETHDTLESAVLKAVSTGFEVVIYHQNEVIKTIRPY